MSARETAELLLQIGHRMRAASYEGELNPAQWMALRYLSRANAISRTPMAFAKFQATTPGTASAVIGQLKDAGYLREQRSRTDRRSVRLRVTAKGTAALKHDPFENFVRTVDTLEEQKKDSLLRILDELVTSVAERQGQQRFGSCNKCKHLQESLFTEPETAGSPAFVCRLHGTSIQANELDLLCAYFR
jgi:DNA-binding MarR family transcriptional regulator